MRGTELEQEEVLREREEACVADSVSMFFIKRMRTQLEYLCSYPHKGAQQVILQKITQVGVCQLQPSHPFEASRDIRKK
jgi:hypothetical protein